MEECKIKEYNRQLMNAALELGNNFRHVRMWEPEDLSDGLIFSLTNGGIKKEGKPHSRLESSPERAIQEYIKKLYEYSGNILIWRQFPFIDSWTHNGEEVFVVFSRLGIKQSMCREEIKRWIKRLLS